MEVTEIGSYLRNKREELGISMYKLAKDSGLSHTYISQLEKGLKQNPSPEILKKLSQSLKISYALLLEKAGYIDKKILESAHNAINTSHNEDEYWRGVHKRSESIELEIQKKDYEEKLDNTYYWWSKLLSQHNEFVMFVEDDIIQLINKYNLDIINTSELFILDNNTELFWDAVSNKQDISLKKQVLDEIIKICERYTQYTKINNSIETIDTPFELSVVLSSNKLTYKGIELDNDDLRILIGMLNAIIKNRN